MLRAGSDALVMTPPQFGDSPAPRDRSTAELVRLARSGDQDAFAALVVRHERMVLRTAMRLLGRLDRAQDAAQETFLRLFRYLGRYDEAREMAPWLYRVVVNVCRDLGKGSGSMRLVALEEAPDAGPPGSTGSPEAVLDGLARAEERRLVQSALVALPEKERAALVLRDLEGLKTSEVARILGSSEGTVRSQISIARLKIRAFLAARARGAPRPPPGGNGPGGEQ